MTQVEGQAARRQHGADEAQFGNRPAQLDHRFVNVLQRQERHAFQARALLQVAIMQPIVVRPRDQAGPIGMADVADAQPFGRIEHGKFEIRHLDKLQPLLGPDPLAAAEGFLIARRMAADVMKVEGREQPVPTQLMILRPIGSVEIVEQTVVLDHMAIGIDDFVVHGGLPRISWSNGVLE